MQELMNDAEKKEKYRAEYQARKLYFAQRYENQKNQILSSQKEYRENNPNAHKEWVENNKEKVKAYKKEWHEKNKVKTNIRRQLRRMNDPNFKIATSLRSSLIHRLKEIKKSKSALVLLGCSILEFKSYIESKFEVGMSWDNHGKYGWHLDHIIPCSSFNLIDLNQQAKCFHYTNFQPLWWKDNLSKGGKLL